MNAVENIVAEYEGELRVSSEAVAHGVDAEHRAVLQLIGTHMESLERFGQVAFEMRAGYNNAQVRVAQLTEQQVTLLMTFMRNTEPVVAFKVAVVEEFYRMRQALVKPAELSTLQIIELAREAELARIAAEEKVAALEPKAGAWDDLASAEGDYEVADAAKILTRAGIKTGRDRLFAYMHEIGWLFRRAGRWQAVQSHVDAGRLREIPTSYEHKKSGERRVGAPQVRVTVKGLEQLRARMLPPVTDLATT